MVRDQYPVDIPHQVTLQRERAGASGSVRGRDEPQEKPIPHKDTRCDHNSHLGLENNEQQGGEHPGETDPAKHTIKT